MLTLWRSHQAQALNTICTSMTSNFISPTQPSLPNSRLVPDSLLSFFMWMFNRHLKVNTSKIEPIFPPTNLLSWKDFSIQLIITSSLSFCILTYIQFFQKSSWFCLQNIYGNWSILNTKMLPLWCEDYHLSLRLLASVSSAVSLLPLLIPHCPVENYLGALVAFKYYTTRRAPRTQKDSDKMLGMPGF